MKRPEILSLEQTLPIVETFYSIQGEGFHSGKPAHFIRLAGCDVCCTWCDEKIAWDEHLFSSVPISQIINNVFESKANAVVITGGEPFRHNLRSLSAAIKKRKILLLAETSGTEAITGQWDWITLSPKKHHRPLLASYEKANELKVVIQQPEDILWAETNEKLVNAKTHLYLQPEWSCFNEIIPVIIRYIKENPRWRLSVQTHKFLNIP